MAIFEIPATIRVEAESIEEARGEVESFLAYGNEVGNDAGIFRNHSVGVTPLTPVVLPMLDWRIQEGGNDADVPLCMRQKQGSLTINRGSYGVHLDVETPDGRKAMVLMEMDAGAFKILVFPPTNPSPQAESEEEAVVHLAVKTGGVIVSNGVGQEATLYEPQGKTSSCEAYNGFAILDALQADERRVTSLSDGVYSIRCTNGEFWTEEDAPLVFRSISEVVEAAKDFLSDIAESELTYAPDDIEVVRNDGAVASYQELLDYSMTDWLFSVQHNTRQGHGSTSLSDRYWEALMCRRYLQQTAEEVAV